MLYKLKYLFIVLSLIVFHLNFAFAYKVRHIARSPRALLMGDAYTAIAEDEYTLFYNPALLARHNFFTFNPINVQATVTNPTKSGDRFTSTPTEPIETAEKLMNYPIHLGFGFNPGLKMGNFGMSAIVNSETNMLLQNTVTPMFDIDHRFDRGFMAGFAYPIWGNYNSYKGGEHLAIGVSVKFLSRESIYQSYNLTSTRMIDAIGGGGGPLETMQALGLVQGSAIGGDIGLDYAKRIGAAQSVFFSVALLDPFTRFTTVKNPDKNEVQPQPMQANVGVGYRMDLGALLDLTLSADYRNFQYLKQGDEYFRDLRLGFEVGNSFIRGLAGFNSGYYSYGLQTNLLFFKAYVGFFDVEMSSKYKLTRSDRALIYLSLFDFEFTP